MGKWEDFEFDLSKVVEESERFKVSNVVLSSKGKGMVHEVKCFYLPMKTLKFSKRSKGSTSTSLIKQKQ